MKLVILLLMAAFSISHALAESPFREALQDQEPKANLMSACLVSMESFHTRMLGSLDRGEAASQMLMDMINEPENTRLTGQGNSLATVSLLLENSEIDLKLARDDWATMEKSCLQWLSNSEFAHGLRKGIYQNQAQAKCSQHAGIEGIGKVLCEDARRE